MGRIPTKVIGPSRADIAAITRGFSLYRATHFYERKSLEELERRAIDRRLPPKGQLVRMQRQVGL